jgi:hypothetical protein
VHRRTTAVVHPAEASSDHQLPDEPEPSELPPPKLEPLDESELPLDDEEEKPLELVELLPEDQIVRCPILDDPPSPESIPSHCCDRTRPSITPINPMTAAPAMNRHSSPVDDPPSPSKSPCAPG